MTDAQGRHARPTQYLALMRRAAELAQYVPGGSIHLAFASPGADISAGEVLVQHPDQRGGYALIPRRLERAGSTDAAVSVDPQLASEIQAATELASKLWIAVVQAGGPAGHSSNPIHLAGLVDREALAEMVLPIGDARPEGQAVTLVERDGDWLPMRDGNEIAAAYEAQPRTRTYVSLEVTGYGPYALTALLLSGLARCRVVCTPYESVAGDATIGEHGDEWYGIALQVAGEKIWTVQDEYGEPMEVLMRPGDVLLVPRLAHHDVRTPHHSVHILYAVLTHEPLDGVAP